MARIANINVDKNISILREEVKNNSHLSDTVKKSITETTEVVEILLERLSRKKPGKPSSEKTSKEGKGSSDKKEKDKRPPRNQLPSKRYPNAPVIEKDLDFEEPPKCPCCQEEMTDSGMKEEAEQLCVIPKRHLIYRFLKHKYKCTHCHGGMLTAPQLSRIVPGSSYSDNFVIDVALSKYCDLLPIERYVAMAARNGLEGLPAQSLIGLTHHLANFLRPVFAKIKVEVLLARILCADETPHRMLEGGGGKKLWYLWGFSCEIACFFEVHNTRSGDVASVIFKESRAEYLVSDVYSGYGKAVKETNKDRKEKGIPVLLNAYCNAHARRYFYDQEEHCESDVRFFLWVYRRIYRLEDEKVRKERGYTKEDARAKMGIYFKAMKLKCKKLESEYSPRSAMAKAIGYYWNNYEGLTRCLKDVEIPLDNNGQEGLLRPPVVGRKTWLGTHSERGAKTAATLQSIDASCRLNKVNQREYFPYVVGCIHRGESPPTPYEYAQMLKKGVLPSPDTS